MKNRGWSITRYGVLVTVIVCIMVGAVGCTNAQNLSSADLLATLRGMAFDQFVEESYIVLLKRTPEAVTALGMDADLGMTGDQLNDLSPEFISETQELESGIFEMLQTYDRDELTDDQQITYDIYYWYLDDLVKGHTFTYNDYPINTIVWSLNVDLTLFFADIIPVTTIQEAENYITRLTQVKQKFDQLIEGLRLREDRGVILPAALIEWVLPDLSAVSHSSAEVTEFYTSFETKINMIEGISEDEKQDLLDRAAESITTYVIPAFDALYDYFLGLRGIAPREIGIGHTPGGDETYAYMLRHFTTTEMTVLEVHQLGLDELQSIQARMREIFNALGYPQDESLTASFARVVEDGGILTGQEIYNEHVRLIEYAENRASELFNILPQVDVIVVADPAGGFYTPPAYDGSRPGMFFAQVTGNAPRFNLPSLTFHETIPGHHYQFAIIPQLELPLFRINTAFTGYTEGWALYAERLMWELGAYDDDPYGELGYLRYQALRAARLVIDTGINGLDWTFEEAVAFIVENTGSPEGYCEYEVARAATVPGQSSSYYVGYMTILDLRQQMQDALGDDFDIKTFHDQILGYGPVPLTIFQDIIEQQIQSLTQ